jgi:hypothetical protein
MRIPRTAGQSVSRADIEQITAEHVYWYRRRNRRR